MKTDRISIELVENGFIVRSYSGGLSSRERVYMSPAQAADDVMCRLLEHLTPPVLKIVVATDAEVAAARDLELQGAD